jgi:hypothetical protein
MTPTLLLMDKNEKLNSANKKSDNRKDAALNVFTTE